MAPYIRTLPQSGQLKGVTAYPGGEDLAGPEPSRNQVESRDVVYDGPGVSVAS